MLLPTSRSLRAVRPLLGLLSSRFAVDGLAQRRSSAHVLEGVRRFRSCRTGPSASPRYALRMERPIVNLDELEYREYGHGERFGGRSAGVGDRLGGRLLGSNVTIVPPGRLSCPFHAHRVNEELFFVMEGEGELRFGDARHALRAGDFFSCPPGGPEVAHAIANTSTERELRFLALSTRLSPEIVVYPDSDKVGVMADVPGKDGAPAQRLRLMMRSADTRVDYWDGE